MTSKAWTLERLLAGVRDGDRRALARVITGLLPPSEGRITFEGKELPKALKGRTNDELRRIQMIYQMPDSALNPRQTVYETIGRPIEFYRASEPPRPPPPPTPSGPASGPPSGPGRVHRCRSATDWA